MKPKSFHIVYVGPFRFPDGDAAAARVLNNARALRLAGHNVDFLSYGGKLRPEDATPEGYVFDGFRYTITRDIDRSNDRPLKRIFNFLVQGTNAFSVLRKMPVPDLVIAYNPALVMVLRLLHWSALRPVRIIADISECYHPSEFPGGKWMPFAWMNELNIGWIIRRIPSKIVISSYLDRFYAGTHNLVVPPLVDTCEDKWQQKTKLLPEFEGMRCIYAGTPTGKDQVMFVLDALKQAIDSGVRIELVFLGEGMEQLQEMVSSTRFAAYRTYVLFPGKVPQHEVPACYKSADFSLLFREHNRKNDAGFPTKFVESMAAGVPVVGNLTSDIASYLHHKVNGWVIDSISAEALAEVFIQLGQLTASERSAMKEAARATAVQHFDYRSHQEQLNHFITSAMPTVR